MRRSHPILLVCVLAASFAPAASAGNSDRLTILGAASLREAFPAIDSTQRYSFAGSDTLAAQVRAGVPADVFAAANAQLPDALFAERLVERPVVFATNRLVLLVPASNPANIRTVFDLRRGGLKLIIGQRTVPVGSYTRQVLSNLGLSSVLGTVVSQERDVAALTTKVALGEADAGFVYATDARVAGDKVRVIKLPAWAQPKVRYKIAILRASGNRAEAAAFIRKLTGASGRRALLAAGFGVPSLRAAKSSAGR